MITLNLKANTPQERTVLENLLPIVSDVLANKINNGVRIQKDGKTLLNKKDLTTFMEYATEQAKKQLAENQRKGTQSVCVHGDDIMSWAIHYFEEDSIEGTLYNEDGTEYKAPAPVKTTTTATTYTPPKPAPKPQISMFDLISSDSNADEELEEEPTPVVEQSKPAQEKGSPMYQHYLSIKEKYKDCIVFYRLGDFYEMFGEDAKIASDILNLTLTGRDCGLKERVSMAGVPFHAVDNYISKLVNNNYKVAICEPINGEMNVERIIAKQPEENQIVDIKSGEILHTQEQSTDTDDELCLDAFDKEAFIILYDLLDSKIDLQ